MRAQVPRALHAPRDATQAPADTETLHVRPLPVEPHGDEPHGLTPGLDGVPVDTLRWTGEPINYSCVSGTRHGTRPEVHRDISVGPSTHSSNR